MSIEQGGKTTDQAKAATRIEEVQQLYETVGETLNDVIKAVKAGEFKDIDQLPKQLTQMTGLAVELRKRETAFNDKYGNELAQGDIDFDALRREIGCRLGRIRKCCRTQSVSAEPDE